VALLVHNYFEQAELIEPKRALREAGATVVIVAAGAEDGKVQGLDHVEKADVFIADTTLVQANIEEYDALVLPGGAVNADNLRMERKAHQWVRATLDAGKPLAVICHAPWVLASAGVAKGRKLTSFFTIQDDMRNAGALWVDSEVVIDGTLITSRKPDDLPAFTQAIITMLNR
jgi:protease I